MTKVWKIIAAAVVYMIISIVFRTIESMMTMDYYMDEAYFPVWSKIMMPTAGPPPIEFTYTSIIFAFIGGLLFAGVYNVIAKGVPGKTVLRKGINYGLLIWIVAGIPFSLSMVLLINLPIDLIAFWTVTTLIIYLLAGAALVKIVK